MNTEFNLLAFGTDSYKQTHWCVYPPNTQVVYSYCEPRAGARFDENVFFGLQYILSRYLAGQVVTREKIEEAAAVCEAHFGRADVFNREGWEYILNTHGGKLPVRIKALPEGSVVPTGTALFTIENTDPNVPWLTNYLETLLMHVWSPTTVATSSREIKKIVSRYLEKTGDPEGLSFKLHDFGYRGVSSLETASLAGAAHLVNFMGTDTMPALSLLRDYYGEPMAGFSIPAMEHSVMTARGPEGEADVVRQILNKYKTGLVAMPVDSYDTLLFILDVIGRNRDIYQMICSREGTVVFRPDSGKLPQIDIDVFNALERVFGSSKNNKGYKILPPYARMIQGDGIQWHYGTMLGEYEWRNTVEDILYAFCREGISADNIAFGSGGGLLQQFDRDTQCFATKCSAMQVNGEWRDIFKQPKTDPSKNSKRGRLAVIKTKKDIETVQEDDIGDDGRWAAFGLQNLLQTVFENGYLTKRHTLSEIRERAVL